MYDLCIILDVITMKYYIQWIKFQKYKFYRILVYDGRKRTIDIYKYRSNNQLKNESKKKCNTETEKIRISAANYQAH